ncbi:MAG: hypothetical protein JXR83_20925 [Deltaproteobacteria bacterium]|nr:hypothetical protein [Deltaproteobacteria bacterium]
MKKLTILVWMMSALFLLACPTPEPEEDGGSAADAGSADRRRTDANAPHDTGSGTWVVSNYGKACTTAMQCPGGICDLMYEDVNKHCWKKCESEDDCSDFPIAVPTGGQLVCQTLTGGTDKICILASPQGGVCGDPVNAGCAGPYGGLCLLDPTEHIGFCAQACNPDQPTVNSACSGGSAWTQVCGCQSPQVCSVTDGLLTTGDGVCAPSTAEGATCGLVDGLYVICTGTYYCQDVSQTTYQGTCQTAADAGPPPTDAGSAG